MLKLNIQFFADGDDEFDLDAIMDQFEQTLTDDVEEETDVEEGVDNDEEVVDEEETETDDSKTSDDTTPDDNDTDANNEQSPGNNTPQDNGRWKEMRQQAQQAQVYQDTLSKIAQANGLTVEQLVGQMQEQQLAVEAEQNGVPVEVQRRLNDLEMRNEQSDRDRILGQVDSDIRQLTKEYGLQAENDPMVQNAFKYIAQNGYVDQRNLPTMRFQDAFFLANKESIAKKQADSILQTELAKKKERQNATIATSNSGTSDSSNVIDDAELTKSVLDDLRNDGYID